MTVDDVFVLQAQVKHLERMNRLLRRSLRDEFAGLAMQSLIAEGIGRVDGHRVSLHGLAYEHADAMLLARGGDA